MSDRDLALEALSAICNVRVTSHQAQERRAGSSPLGVGLGLLSGFGRVAMGAPTMTVTGFIPMLAGSSSSVREHILDEYKFFDPDYDYDFSDLEDTETYYRGGEVYERPCGWKRFALKVLDKFPDGNAWLGERGYRSGTSSKSGEWPVSYHGTSMPGARGIIVSKYEPGSGQKYGRGIYSTPYISETAPYIKKFTYETKTYEVLMQNRINPKYREKHNNGKYWLVPLPQHLSNDKEQEIVEEAIRPYSLLVRRV